MKNTPNYVVAAFSLFLGGLSLASVLSPRHEIKTQIEIAASSDRVWAVLTDTAAYPSWNPFIRKLTGYLAAGQRLTVSLGSGGMVFHPKVVAVLPGQRLQWNGRLWGLPGLFTGIHSFEIIPTNHGTIFLQSETFSGMLLWFYDAETVRAEFAKMNRALKTRIEAP